MAVRFRRGRIVAVVDDRPLSQIVAVQIIPETPETSLENSQIVRAFHDVTLLGRCRPGQVVVLNTTARWLELGTGGVDFVYWIEGAEPPEPGGSGHLMKLRYTPGQRRVFAVEESGHPLRPHYIASETALLEHRPVVVIGLHSQLAAVVAGIQQCGRFKVAFVQTAAGALPLHFSELVRQLCEASAISRTVTVGHAYGGDLEAVSIHSGLLAAAASGAEAIVIGPGPGLAGTGTKMGNTAVEQGSSIDTAAALEGIPIIAPRLSSADSRPRHAPLSHHTLTALQLAARSAWVPLPRLKAETSPYFQQLQVIRNMLSNTPGAERHVQIEIDAEPAIAWLDQHQINPDTMGRELAQDPLPFLAAGAAGMLAGRFAALRSIRTSYCS